MYHPGLRINDVWHFQRVFSPHFALLAVDWFLLYKLYPCGWVWDVTSLIFDSPGWCSVRYTCWWRVALCRHLFAFSALRRAIQSAGPLARLEAAVKYLSAPRSYQRYHRNLLFLCWRFRENHEIRFDLFATQTLSRHNFIWKACYLQLGGAIVALRPSLRVFIKHVDRRCILLACWRWSFESL